MKLKYPLILGLIHLILLGYFLVFSSSKNFVLNIILLICFLNISSFFLISFSFKKKLVYFIGFSAFSLISLVSGVILLTAIAMWIKQFNIGMFLPLINKYYVFAHSMEKDYNSILGNLRLIFSYIIFALMPSFIVLSLGFPEKAKKRKGQKKRKHKKL